jgi:hypothetical protein
MPARRAWKESDPGSMREEMVGTAEILNEIAKSSLLLLMASSLVWLHASNIMENTYARQQRLDASHAEPILNGIQYVRLSALHA